MRQTRRGSPALTVGALSWVLAAGSALAFTQKAAKGGVFSPIGHEFLVLRAAKDSGLPAFEDSSAAALAKEHHAALKALEKKGVLKQMGWTVGGVAGAAQSLQYGRGTRSKYEEIIKYSLDAAADLVKGARSLRAFSVVVGQRWVDEMGFAQVGVVSGKACFNTVAQEPEEIMADHFMRRGDVPETDASAHKAAIARFQRYYAAAVKAPDTLVPFRDGALTGGAFYVVSEAYMLLGRAVHLVQDSFSPDHTLRGTGTKVVVDPPYYTKSSTENDYMKIALIKDWDCSPDTYQHSHVIAGPGLTPGNNDISGDIIWKPFGQRESKLGACVADLKPVAKAAFNATKDLYAIFVAQRGKGSPDTYSPEGDEALKGFVQKWLSLDESIAVPPVSATSKKHRRACQKLKGRVLGIEARAEKERERNKRRQKCLKRSGRLSADAADADHNKPPYFWRGK